MKKMILICSFALLLMSQTLIADAAAPSSAVRNEAVGAESVGFGSGAVIGALAGGPVGALVGASLGTWLGNRVHDAGKLQGVEGQLAASQAELSKSSGLLSAMRRDIVTLEAAVGDRDIRIAALRDINDDRALYSALGKGIEVDVLFRTGNADLAPETGQRLIELARVLGSVPGLDVRLDGYADPRGDSGYNAQLSLQRVATVESVLHSAGLDRSRIRRYSHGESHSSTPEGDLDGYAMERKVSITFIDAAALADDGPGEHESVATTAETVGAAAGEKPLALAGSLQ